MKKTGGDVACVLCLGHNKGMEEAASSLTVRHWISVLSTLETKCPLNRKDCLEIAPNLLDRAVVHLLDRND